MPLGRFGCSLDELAVAFVDASPFASSQTRAGIFDELLSVIELFESFSPSLIESIWIGGSFVTSKIDPNDIDCLFILSSEAYNGLSKTKQQKVARLGHKNHVREKFNFRVEPFVMVRAVIASPWELGGGITREAASYTEIRGAWDDWWLRARTTEDPNDDPLAESAHPRRGYLEVTP